ncbi:MAG: glycosyltransferase [Muribaculaceae bacterium]|nr:glycosyltransferase [Muribaculaceae bacterium]
MNPLFSIITVTYNAENTLPATVDSVRQQTFTDYEHLVIDGKSKDRTVEIATDAHPRIKVTSEPDSGLYDAMNKGLDRACGKYLIFLNAGDSFHSPDTLAKIADAIIANNYPGIVYGQTDIVDSQRRKIADRHLTAPQSLDYKSFADGMVVCHQAFVTLARIAPQFNLKYRFSADYEWCIRCLQHSRKNVYVGDTIIDYLFEGLTTANRRKSLTERFRIMARYYGVLPTVWNHLRFLPRFVARTNQEKKLS